MTSQTDNQLGNLSSDFHCSIVFHTVTKIHNFFISDPIFLKHLCFVSPVFLHLLKASYFWSGLSL